MGNFFSKPEVEKPKPKPRPTPRKFVENHWVPVVLLYSYVGTGYHGLQFNDQQPTIEKILLDAISDAGLIPPRAYYCLSKIKWNEASRTDVGVHAAAQVVSFKLSLPNGYKIRDVVPLISKYLPPDSPITIWKALSMSNNFNAQKFADGRQYKYLMPLHAFKEQTEKHLQYIRSEILPHFVGTKNYHNYTKRVTPQSERCKRTITKFDISHSFKINGEEYVLWTINGKSFMMNQIRKMLATVLAVSYGLLSLENLDNTFTLQRWSLSKLPGDGLFLDKVEYTANKKKYADHSWDVEFDDSRLSVNNWKETVLYPKIAKLVEETDLFRNWIDNVLLVFPPAINNEE